MRRGSVAPLGAVALSGFALVLGAVLAWGRSGPTPLDTWWNGLMTQVQAPVLTEIALFLNVFGGPLLAGLIVPALLVLLLVLRRRLWAAGFLVVASALSAGAVEVIKLLVRRPRPGDVEIATNSFAFPSGHTANATVVVLALALIWAAQRWIRFVGALYILAMALSRTYLHAHWLTDVVAGFLLAAGIALLAWALGRRVLQRKEDEAQSHRGHPREHAVDRLVLVGLVTPSPGKQFVQRDEHHHPRDNPVEHPEEGRRHDPRDQ